MEKSERIQAELEAKLKQFDLTINELRLKAERQNETYKALQRISIEELEGKKREAQEKLKTISGVDEERKGSLSSELMNFMNDIDDSLRKALSQFK